MKTLLTALLLLFMLVASACAERNRWLDIYLKEYDVKLPDEYVAIADQPVGLVSRFIVVDLKSGDVDIFPGTHARIKGSQPRRAEPLNPESLQFLRRLLASEFVSGIPEASGKFGADGRSLVVYYRIKGTERFISHWSPEHVGLFMFAGIVDRYYPWGLEREFKRSPNQSEPSAPPK